MPFHLICLACVTALLMGCANAPDYKSPRRSDPIERFNRTIFDFNYNILDPYVLRPIAVAWRDYLPIPARNGLSNFTSNLEEPASMVNAFLKGNPYRGMIDFNRFFLNTLLGMGGLIDVAGMANPKLTREEARRFGSTLGHYNISYGPYIMLPGYGSFTLRENGGDLVDTLYPMLNYLTFWMSISKWVIESIETRAHLLDTDGLLRHSSNPYIIMREAYFQHHDFIANDALLKPDNNSNAQAIQSDLNEIDSIQ